MFVVKNIPEITVPVDINVPGEDAASRIFATWKLHTYDGVQERRAAIASGEMSDEQVTEADLVNLSDLSDEQGNKLDFTPELVAQLLQMTYVRTPLIQSWFVAQSGRSEAAAKN